MLSKKKNILIIGCYGHIGFSTAIHLSKKYNVVGTFNKTINKKLKLELETNSVKLFNLDVGNKKSLSKLFKKFNFDTCIYAAAIAHDSIAKKNIEKTIFANCLGIINFLSLNENKCKFIYISTGSVFQNIASSRERISEYTKVSPASIYSVSKRLGELITSNFFEKNYRSTILRVSWVYGPPIITKKIDVQRGPVPFILTQLFYLNKNKIYFKSGRDFEASFTYISDVCHALEHLIKLKKFLNPVFHLGSGKNYKLSQVSKIISSNFKNKTLYMGKGFRPWSLDSVIRGPLVSKIKKNKLKTRYSLKKGLFEYINFLINIKKK